MKLPAVCLAAAFAGGVARFACLDLRSLFPAKTSFVRQAVCLLMRLAHSHYPVAVPPDCLIHILTDGNQIEISCFVECKGTTARLDSATAQSPDHP